MGFRQIWPPLRDKGLLITRKYVIKLHYVECIELTVVPDCVRVVSLYLIRVNCPPVNDVSTPLYNL